MRCQWRGERYAGDLVLLLVVEICVWAHAICTVQHNQGSWLHCAEGYEVDSVECALLGGLTYEEWAAT